MKVLVHAQHLSGVGHHVRALELARRLAESHRVVLVDGGREVPRADPGAAIERLALPRIGRREGRLVALDPDAALPAALAERRARLARCAADLAPDAVVVEHHPFSKWELGPEIAASVDAARRANPAVRVVCSVRDVCRRTRHETGSADAWTRRVIDALHARFDAVLVHADERFTRLEDHFPGAEDLRLPVFHTGFVSERRRADAARAPRRPAAYAVLSVGGGSGSAGFALDCIAAWRRLHAESGAPVLVVFSGLSWSEAERARVRAATAEGPFRLEPFGVDLIDWLDGAALSMSRAGYNTCANLLETGCPALVVPHPEMSDQAFRARRLAELGLVETLPPGEACEATLAEAMRRTLQRPRPTHDLDLDGASRSARLLESLVAAGPDLLPLIRAQGGRLRGLALVTGLPSPLRRRAAFALDFADGPRRKGRRCRSAVRARTVAALLEAAAEGFPRLLGSRGDALLLEWVPGPTLASLSEVPAEVLRRCGEQLGALHARRIPAGIEEPVRSAAVLHAGLRRDVAVLERARWLDAARARRVLEVARVHAPGRASEGVVHGDFCAENLVLNELGTPVSIDNGSLHLGCHDFDLARTWARWPMSRADRRRFAEGYTKQRSLEPFLAAFPFWACCALLLSAARRLQARTGREAVPLGRLERLLAQLGDGASDPGDAFWAS